MPEGNEAARPAIELDEEGKKLQLEAEKAKYLEAIVRARKETAGLKAEPLKALVPDDVNSPKGEVTVGDKAGAFGPWRAHQVIDGVARKVAESVPVLLGDTSDPRVLVVDDLSLLPGDWTAHHLRSMLDRLSTRMRTLRDDISHGMESLSEAIDRYEADEAAQEPRMGRRRGAAPSLGEDTTTTAAASSAPLGASAGAFSSAVDLLGLLRTDYNIIASTVSATTSELVTLTAGHLATRHQAATLPGANTASMLVVEADGFSTMRASPSTEQVTALLQIRDETVRDLSRVKARLAPVEAELTSLQARTALVEQTWAAATAETTDEAATKPLRSAADELLRQATRRHKAAGPARALVEHAEQIITDVDAALTALLQAQKGDEAPLLTAVRRERLDATVNDEQITHVLYVSLDAAAADAVTRRSILGVSGSIRFLSGSNASWLLLKTSSGTIAGGGQVSLADVMTFGLEEGKAEFTRNGQWLEPSLGVGKDDPLKNLEKWAKGLVVALIVMLFIVGILSILAFLAVLNVALG